jgi:acylphosphatase
MLGAMQAVRVVVSGRVQGVGFRAWVAREATSLGVAGRVWNRSDGRVEVEAVGPAATLERFLAALRQGPRLARVEQVAEQWFECREAPRGFQVTG